MMQAVSENSGEIFGADFEDCGSKQNGGLALTGCVDSYVEQRQGIGEIGGVHRGGGQAAPDLRPGLARDHGVSASGAKRGP